MISLCLAFHYPSFRATCANFKTCAQQSKNCGTMPDGCGGTEDCGTCGAPNTCGGGGVADVCGCTPTTSSWRVVQIGSGGLMDAWFPERHGVATPTLGNYGLLPRLPALST